MVVVLVVVVVVVAAAAAAVVVVVVVVVLLAVVVVVVVVVVAAAGIVVVVVVVVVVVEVEVGVVGVVVGPPSFPGANLQQMVIARLSLGLSFLGLRNFLKLCHDEKPCTWWLGEKGLGSLQSRLARMLHHEYDALKGYRFLGGAISFYSVSCMSDVIFNPSLLNWSSLILTVAHMDSIMVVLANIRVMFGEQLLFGTLPRVPNISLWHPWSKEV